MGIQLPRVLKAFNLYIDGEGYAGRVTSCTLPALAFTLEDYRGGGMDVPKKLEMGMEAMTVSMVIADHDPALIARLGTDGLPVTLRKSVQRQGPGNAAETIIVNMRGLWAGVEFAETRVGAVTPQTCTAELDYFRYRQNDVEFCEIDALNMVRRFGGVDQLAASRAAIGL